MTGEETPDRPQVKPACLRRALGGFQYFTIALGSMIGIGWITVLGEWLGRAGPLGAMLGFLAGGLVMAGIAACYAELTGVMPLSGGDVVFADRVFGRDAAFFVGWFLVLVAISVVSFEALSFVWVAQTLWPALGSQPLYRLLDRGVGATDIALGTGAVLAMYLFNRNGVDTSARMQDALTALKLIVMSTFIGTAMLTGDPHGL